MFGRSVNDTESMCGSKILVATALPAGVDLKPTQKIGAGAKRHISFVQGKLCSNAEWTSVALPNSSVRVTVCGQTPETVKAARDELEFITAQCSVIFKFPSILGRDR